MQLYDENNKKWTMGLHKFSTLHGITLNHIFLSVAKHINEYQCIYII